MGYKKQIKICKYCQSQFLGVKSRKYCGKECTINSRKKQKTLKCNQCGIEFNVQNYRDAKFCSYECKIKNQTSSESQIKCDNCGQVFLRKSYKKNKKNNFCCKKCSDLFHISQNHYEWKDYIHIKGRKDALRKWGCSVKNNDNNTCRECGNTDKRILQAHHIIPKSINKNLEFDEQNGITLCIYCHLKKHENDSRSYRLIKSTIDNYEIQMVNKK